MNDRLEEADRKVKLHEYQEGLDLLETIQERSAKWYYINGYANSCMGNNIIAREMLAQAVNMDPDNAEYIQLLNHLNGAAQSYEDSTYGCGMGKAKNHNKDLEGDGCCSCCCGSKLWLAYRADSYNCCEF